MLITTQYKDKMVLSHFSTDKLIVAKKVVPSSTNGLSNLIMPDDRVFSCQGDGSMGDRDSGTDGSWEQGKIEGNLVTYHPGDYYFTFGFIITDGIL